MIGVQLDLVMPPVPEATVVRDALLEMFKQGRRPTAEELVSSIEESLGIKARWHVAATIEELAKLANLPRIDRDYLNWLMSIGNLDAALRGSSRQSAANVASTIDELVRHSIDYRSSAQFKEMIEFMAKFRAYAPYNNMLVRIQKPSCSFYASETDWRSRFERHLKEDARPLLILMPFGPVMLVYDLDQTDGKDVPRELLEFAKFEGAWDPAWLARTRRNAAEHDAIRVDEKTLSSTNAGFATVSRGDKRWKMRIALHDELNESSRYGVLCHELAHIYLGHLGGDQDNWWPSRAGVDRRTAEIEAETVAYITTQQLGLTGSSVAYVSRYLKEDEELPPTVSLHLIAKISGRLKEMALRTLPARQPRQ